MADQAQDWVEETVSVAGTELVFIRGGTGRPLLVLHEELGHPGWLKWHAALARDHTLLIPHQPGFGKSPKLDWTRSIRDVAAFYSRVLRERDLIPIDVIGFSLGGWIAAEMAANHAGQFRHMVLVGPAGIQPPRGEIKDLFIRTSRKFLDESVLNPSRTPEFASLYSGEETSEQFEAWEDARSETARLAWSPYLFNHSLPHLLEGVSGLPTLLIWGAQDEIVPLSASEVYKQSIPGAELSVFEQCGHHPEIEKSNEFIKTVQQFLG
jgi:pimeloyl-ACP methyl ester carboxylesterase